MHQRAKQSASCAGCHVRQPLKTLAARNRAAFLQCGSSPTEGLSAPVPAGEEELRVSADFHIEQKGRVTVKSIPLAVYNVIILSKEVKKKKKLKGTSKRRAFLSLDFINERRQEGSETEGGRESLEES